MGSAPSATKHRIGRGVLVALVAAVVAICVALGLLLTQGTNQAAPVAAQLASVQAGCTQWLAAKPAQAGTGQWCTEMASWMSQYMDRSGVGPQMMWGDSDHMLSACEQWMTTSPPSGTAAPPQSWCNSMVSWMTSHMRTWSGHDSWGAWMSHGQMMGGSRP
jgi:hypothetical protein